MRYDSIAFFKLAPKTAKPFVTFQNKYCFFSHTPLLSSFWTQAVVTGVVSSSSPVLAFNFYRAYRVQQSHCLSIFRRVWLTYAFALSASQFVRKKKSPRIYMSLHSGRIKLTKLTYNTRLEYNLIRHRGDRVTVHRLVLFIPRGVRSRCQDVQVRLKQSTSPADKDKPASQHNRKLYYNVAKATELNRHTTRMKIRGSAVSLSFSFPHSPEDEIKNKKKYFKNQNTLQL